MVNVLVAVAPYISIHAPTRGATIFIFVSHRCHQDFNPRSHKGSDQTDFSNNVYHRISIHAPTRGATHGSCSYSGADLISIHAPTRGATNNTHKGLIITFQSTLPQGERPKIWLILIMPFYFNPRSHKGSDCKNAQFSFQSIIHFHPLHLINFILHTNHSLFILQSPPFFHLISGANDSAFFCLLPLRTHFRHAHSMPSRCLTVLISSIHLRAHMYILHPHAQF